MNNPQTPTIHLHKGDLPPDVTFGGSVAVDTETMGLNPYRDRLCVVQLSAGDGVCHLVQLPRGQYDAPNLKKVLGDPSVTKIFHYARFDLAIIEKFLGVTCTPVYCTKIVSKLVRTYGESHGLKALCRELLGIELSKQQQTSDWGAETLTPEQQQYAAADVLYLHRLRDLLEKRLEREGRTAFSRACFEFLPTRARLDLAGWPDEDIFSH